jgi:hypothetical protein
MVAPVHTDDYLFSGHVVYVVVLSSDVYLSCLCFNLAKRLILYLFSSSFDGALVALEY